MGVQKLQHCCLIETRPIQLRGAFIYGIVRQLDFARLMPSKCQMAGC